MAVLTESGLVIRRYPEIIQLIQNTLLEQVSSTLIFDTNDILGQIVNILSVQWAAIEEMLQVLNDNMDRDKAEGASLDALLKLIGVIRLAAAPTSGYVQFITDEGVILAEGTIVKNPSSGDRFLTTEEATADISSCQRVWASVDNLPDGVTGVTYGININADEYDVAVPAATTAEADVVDYIVNEINTAHGSVDYELASYVEGGTTYLQIGTVDDDNIIVQFEGTDLTVFRVEVQVPIECEENGYILAGEGTVTELVSGIAGVLSVRNDEALGVGRNRETDTEYRLRASQELSFGGSATYSAMYSALANTSGVSNLVLIENNTNATDANGLPAKSFEAVVDVPDTVDFDQLIASVIWSEKPIGVESYGDTAVTYVDSIGQPRIINFSRPTDIHIAVQVTYALYDEEAAPDNIVQIIKQAVVDKGATYSSGKDIYPKKFSGPIYDAVGTGLGDITVEMQVLANSGDAPVGGSWSEAVIDIAPREVASFNIDDVSTVAV